MAFLDDFAAWKTYFNNEWPTTNNIPHMSSTYQTNIELGREYSFRGPCWFLFNIVRSMESTKDTFWADHGKNIIDRMLSRRDDRSEILGEWNPAAQQDDYTGYMSGPRYYLNGQPGDNTAAKVWHRVERAGSSGVGQRALILDNGIILNSIMQWVDAVLTYSEFSSYVQYTSAFMDDVQEVVDEFHRANYSSYRYNFNGTGAINGNITGAYYWEAPNGSGLQNGQPEINQQNQFLCAQLLLYKYRPQNNPDAVNRITQWINHWKNRWVIIMSGGNECYSWPYSMTSLTQSGGSSHVISNATSITGVGPYTYDAEDLGHAVLTVMLPYYCNREGIGGVSDTDMHRFANTAANLMHISSGVMSSTVSAGGSTSHNDTNDYGYGAFTLLTGFDAAIATNNRAVWNAKHPSSNENLFHKEVFNAGHMLYGENLPSAPAPDTTAPTVTITSPTEGQEFDTDPAITATGTAADTGSGVNLVQVRVNGGAWANATTSDSWATWSANITIQNNANTVEARSQDVAGNFSTIALVNCTFTPPDTTAPTVTITSPANLATLQTAMPTVTGTAADADSGVGQVEVRVDNTGNGNNGPWNPVDSGTTSWSYVATLALGDNTIKARSQDVAGNYSNVSFVDVTVDPEIDANDPVVVITGPANASTIRTNRILLQGTASDVGSGVQEVEFRTQRNGGEWEDWGTADGTTSWSKTLKLLNGSYKIQVRATDANGNVSVVQEIDITAAFTYSARLRVR